MAEFRINVTVDPTKAEAGAKRVGGALDRTTKNADRLRATLVRAFAVLGGAAALGGAVRTIAQFEQAMSTVGAVTGATAKQFETLNTLARDLGARTRFSATQAAEGMTFLARAGFDVNEVMASIEGTLRLAQAGAIDLGTAADIASNVLTGFRLEVSETARVVDVLAKAANSSNTNIQQLGDGFKLVGPIAAGVGADFEEVIASLGALADAGLQGTLGGTGLRRVISELESPTTKTLDILSSLGVKAEEVRVSTAGLVEAMARLADAGVTTGQALEIFGDRGGPAFEVLSSSIPRVRELAAALKAAGGTAEEFARLMDDNLNGALLRVRSAYQAVVLALGGSGGSTLLRGAFDGLADVLRAIARNVDLATTAAISLVAALAVPKIVAIGAALTGAGAATGALAAALGAATAAARLLGRALVIGAIIEAVQLLIANWKDFTALLDAHREADPNNPILKFIREVRAEIKGAQDDFADLIGASREPVLVPGQRPGEAAPFVKDAVANALDVARGVADGFRQIFVDSTRESIIQGFAEAGTARNDFFDDTGALIVGISRQLQEIQLPVPDGGPLDDFSDSAFQTVHALEAINRELDALGDVVFDLNDDFLSAAEAVDLGPFGDFADEIGTTHAVFGQLLQDIGDFRTAYGDIGAIEVSLFDQAQLRAQLEVAEELREELGRLEEAARLPGFEGDIGHIEISLFERAQVEEQIRLGEELRKELERLEEAAAAPEFLGDVGHIEISLFERAQVEEQIRLGEELRKELARLEEAARLPGFEGDVGHIEISLFERAQVEDQIAQSEALRKELAALAEAARAPEFRGDVGHIEITLFERAQVEDQIRLGEELRKELARLEEAAAAPEFLGDVGHIEISLFERAQVEDQIAQSTALREELQRLEEAARAPEFRGDIGHIEISLFERAQVEEQIAQSKALRKELADLAEAARAPEFRGDVGHIEISLFERAQIEDQIAQSKALREELRRLEDAARLPGLEGDVGHIEISLFERAQVEEQIRLSEQLREELAGLAEAARAPEFLGDVGHIEISLFERAQVEEQIRLGEELREELADLAEAARAPEFRGDVGHVEISLFQRAQVEEQIRQSEALRKELAKLEEAARQLQFRGDVGNIEISLFERAQVEEQIAQSKALRDELAKLEAAARSPQFFGDVGNIEISLFERAQIEGQIEASKALREELEQWETAAGTVEFLGDVGHIEISLFDRAQVEQQIRAAQALREELERLAELARRPGFEGDIGVGISSSLYDQARASEAAAEASRALREENQEHERVYRSLEDPLTAYVRELSILQGVLQDHPELAERAREAEENLRLAYLDTRTDPQAGLERGAIRLAQEFSDSATLVEGAFVNAFHGAEDALVNFVRTGKLEFGDLVDTILDDLARIVIRDTITGPLSSALSDAIQSGIGAATSGIGAFFGGGEDPLDAFGGIGDIFTSEEGGGGFLSGLADAFSSGEGGGGFLSGLGGLFDGAVSGIGSAISGIAGGISSAVGGIGSALGGIGSALGGIGGIGSAVSAVTGIVTGIDSNRDRTKIIQWLRGIEYTLRVGFRSLTSNDEQIIQLLSATLSAMVDGQVRLERVRIDESSSKSAQAIADIGVLTVNLSALGARVLAVPIN